MPFTCGVTDAAWDLELDSLAFFGGLSSEVFFSRESVDYGERKSMINEYSKIYE